VTNETIYSALISLLNDAVLGYPDTYPIAYPGFNFTPPAEGPWLEVLFFPNRGIDYDVGNSEDVTPQGNFQVAVNDRPGSGVSTLNAAADAVMGVYPKGTRIADNVRVYRPAYVSSIDPVDSVMIKIVTVPYSG
jgi:hypothetical protein